MNNILALPRRLERSDDRSDFNSGADELDDWVRRFAWQNQRANSSVTYVTMSAERVVGYYAIAASGVARTEAHEEVAKGRPATIPCILLARLAVDLKAQGQGVGGALLRDALERSVELSDSLGAAAVLIHCRDEAARDFYLSQGEFLPSPVEPMHLMIPMKAIKALMAEIYSR
jgi:GNAT superfamily N-acetyltransferase